MPIETLDDIIEEIADVRGIYGAHGDELEEPPHHVTCTATKPCRVCWTSGLRDRIVLALDNERKLSTSGTGSAGKTGDALTLPANEDPVSDSEKISAMNLMLTSVNPMIQALARRFIEGVRNVEAFTDFLRTWRPIEAKINDRGKEQPK